MSMSIEGMSQADFERLNTEEIFGSFCAAYLDEMRQVQINEHDQSWLTQDVEPETNSEPTDK